MLGWMHKSNRRHWLRLKVLAFAVVSAALLAPSASARPDEGSAKLTETDSSYLNASSGRSIIEGDLGLASEIAYLSQGTGLMEQGAGGVTPTNLARAYEPLTDKEAAIAAEVPYLSHGIGVIEQGKGGVTPTNLARAFDSRQVDEPALIRDEPDGVQGDLRRTGPETVYVTADSSSSFDERALAIGFGLGSMLVAVAVAVLMLSRGRMRLAS